MEKIKFTKKIPDLIINFSYLILMPISTILLTWLVLFNLLKAVINLLLYVINIEFSEMILPYMSLTLSAILMTYYGQTLSLKYNNWISDDFDKKMHNPIITFLSTENAIKATVYFIYFMLLVLSNVLKLDNQPVLIDISMKSFITVIAFDRFIQSYRDKRREFT